MPANLALLRDLIESAPPQTNGFVFAAAHALRLFIPIGDHSLLPAYVALSVVFATLIVLCAGLLFIRFRRGRFWLVRVETTGLGSFVVCVRSRKRADPASFNVLNVGLISNLVFAITAIASSPSTPRSRSPGSLAL